MSRLKSLFDGFDRVSKIAVIALLVITIASLSCTLFLAFKPPGKPAAPVFVIEPSDASKCGCGQSCACYSTEPCRLRHYPDTQSPFPVQCYYCRREILVRPPTGQTGSLKAESLPPK